MNITFKCLVILTIIYYNSTPLKATYIYQEVHGSLEDSWKYTFRIYIKSFVGVIINASDSKGNQFNIVNTVEHYTCINYNGVKTWEMLQKLCGCEPCDNLWIEFNIKSTGDYIITNCNNGSKVSLSKFQNIANNIKDNTLEKDSKGLPSSKERMYQNKTIYIVIGNLMNPYIKERVVGCLDFFYYNKQLLSFKGNGKKIQPYCLYKCVSSTCNGGICQEINNSKLLCDCFNTKLNGEFCNKSMEMYNPRSDNIYEIINNISDTYFKMTWILLFHKRYCLMDLKGRYESIMIWTNTTHLMVDSEPLVEYKLKNTYFINLVMKNKTLLIKMEGMGITRYLKLDIKMKINVGFSYRSKNCETFEGIYDVLYNPGHIKNIKFKKNFNVPGNKTQTMFLIIDRRLMIIMAASFGCLIILIIVLTVLCKTPKKLKIPIIRPPVENIILPVQQRPNNEEDYNNHYDNDENYVYDKV